ncbi:DUF4214 domain-containing protein [Vreelandella subglaciescola]|jgi:hypothetical protein|uniref:DUF4214 domain-containing protein n=1 Tax=Vreelandella subglaciescola TaxID=29571 RepID=A0A1M7H1E0_9GAMM|nr:DUF4214 domain-containing protein [Halomonas subglaciescola]SHM22183.1 protein of unknown function [Halomonas subglaciescola]
MSSTDIIQGLYLTIYERPADWAGLQYWTAELETKDFDAVADAFTQAPEFDEIYAGLTHKEQVSYLYEHLLGRAPEPAGLAFWEGRLNEGATPADLVREIRDGTQGSDQQAIAARIDDATEASYGELIDTLYAGYYDRAADEDGRDYWVEQIQQSYGNLDHVIQAFGESDEYIERFGSLSDEEQVGALYQSFFSRDAETEGINYWVEQLSSGTLDLANIAFAIAEGAGEQGNRIRPHCSKRWKSSIHLSPSPSPNPNRNLSLSPSPSPSLSLSPSLKIPLYRCPSRMRGVPAAIR